MEVLTTSHILFAILGGGLPVLIWLWFWLREDRKNPEPKIMIFEAFLAGITAVLLSIIVQLAFIETLSLEFFFISSFIVLPVILVPITEELFKFILCYFIVLKNKETNEPIDPLIYMIATALGFAALENILYILEPITEQNLVESVITGNMRFIGATLVHIISSASVGIFLAFSFYKSKIKKIIYAVVGIITAIILHSYFNFFIIKSTETEGNFVLFSAFVSFWIMAIALLFFFEKIKKIKPNK